MAKYCLKALAVPLLLILVAVELFANFVTFLSFHILKPFGWLYLSVLVVGGLFGGMIGMSWWEILGLFIFAYVVCMIPEVFLSVLSRISSFRRHIWFYIKTRYPY